MAVEIEDITMIARLPGPGEWNVSIAGHMIVLSSPYAGSFVIVGRQVRQLPRPWDGETLGPPLPPPT